MFDFTYFYNKLILKPKMKEKTATGWQKLRTTYCNGKLHRLMSLGIHMFVQLWNEELGESKR